MKVDVIKTHKTNQLKEGKRMLNIIVPMAGRGSRFTKAGYQVPKPLIPIHGREMVRVVIDNIRPSVPHRFIFLCLQEHIEQYEIDKKLKEWEPDCIVIHVDTVTEGAACTVLLAKEFINNADALMIANSDQWTDSDCDAYLAKMEEDSADGLIMTMKATNPAFSYIGRNAAGQVSEVVEKKVISDEATVGIYNFRKGQDFVQYAEQMIADNLRVNGEFYVAPVFNHMIRDGHTITTYSVGEVDAGMYGLGVPEDLDRFLAMDISHKAAAF